MGSNKKTSLSSRHDHYNDDHVVRDGDFHNVISLLSMLARQLELSSQESNDDYQVITQYCMNAENISAESLNLPKKTDAIKALQYYDRNYQRVEHVTKSLQALVKNLTDESWRAIDMDLSVEVDKTNSFFSECQTKEMHQLAAGVCELDYNKDSSEGSLSKSANDDLELF